MHLQGDHRFLFVFCFTYTYLHFLIVFNPYFLPFFTVVAGTLFELVLHARGSYGGYPLLLLLRL